MTNTPFVSIIMSVHNDAETIVRALGAALDQRYPRDRMEVLVVDGISGDGTFAVVQRATYDKRVRLFDNPQRTPAAALAIGLEHARGDIVVRLDGRTTVPPDYLTACVAALQHSGADYAASPTHTVGTTRWGRAAALAAPPVNGFGAYRREALDHEAWLKPGVAYSSLEVVTRSSDTPEASWRQFFQAGEDTAPVLLRNPLAASARDLAPLAAVLTLGGGALLAPFARRVRRAWLALSALWALALLAASLLAARRAGNPEQEEDELRWRGGELGPLDGGARRSPGITRQAVWARLPLVIACQNVAYGCGLAVGVVRSFTPTNRRT